MAQWLPGESGGASEQKEAGEFVILVESRVKQRCLTAAQVFELNCDCAEKLIVAGACNT